MDNDKSKHSEISAKDIEDNKFITECIETFQNEVLKKPLNILIWGPTEPSDNSDEYKVNLYKKRNEIKECLRKLGHKALFSEEIDAEAKRRLGFNPNAVVFEKIQIDKADTAIMLRVSPGTIGEFHDFYNNPDYARKMYVFFDNAHSSSYTHTGHDEIFVTLGGKLDEFSYPDDIVKCNLQGKVVNHIRKVQMAIYMTPYKKY